MNWEAINAIAAGIGALAVVATLVYLALQVRYMKQQSVLATVQHTYNALNEFDNSIAHSAELASIVIRGRKSLAALSPEEKLRFEHVFGRLLNTVESWLFQVTQTTESGAFRDEQLRNIREIIRVRCNNPGVLEFWAQYKHCYNVEMNRLMDENTDAVLPPVVTADQQAG